MRIIYKQEECIGCGACSFLCPAFFEMADNGKAFLTGSFENAETGNFGLEIKNAKEDEIKCLKEAADSCPVRVISIE